MLLPCGLHPRKRRDWKVASIGWLRPVMLPGVLECRLAESASGFRRNQHGPCKQVSVSCVFQLADLPNFNTSPIPTAQLHSAH
jgi:hypothetical protein